MFFGRSAEPFGVCSEVLPLFLRCAPRRLSPALAKGDSNTFVAGTEGGSLFKCLMDHNEAMCNDFNSHLAENNVPKLRSPVKADYTGHTGPVHDIHCSPFQVLLSVLPPWRLHALLKP